MKTHEEQLGDDDWLLTRIQAKLAGLEALLEELHRKSNYEDKIYRYYHCSEKVYYIQELTERIVDAFKSIAEPHATPNEDFLHIIRDGTGKEWTPGSNYDWHLETRPILEAFFHAK